VDASDDLYQDDVHFMDASMRRASPTRRRTITRRRPRWRESTGRPSP
jgi:hypothetical protein